MKIIVTYKTKTGGSKQYAEWLGEAFGVEPKTFDEIKPEELETCEACAVISGTYIGIMPLTGFLKKNWKVLRNKKVAAVALGGIAPDRRWSRFAYLYIPRSIRKKIKYWKIPGKGDEERPVVWGEIKRENLEPIIEYLRKQEVES